MNLLRVPALAPGASEIIDERLRCLAALIPAPSSITLFDGITPMDGSVRTRLSTDRPDLGSEGYHLTCDRSGFQLTANTEAGLYYGRQTIEQLKSNAPVPCCEIIDSPKLSMRAVMFDLARCKEKHEYYYYMIDRLSHWKINTVFLHLTDHTGCALEFEHCPALATKYAFTRAEMADMIRYAAERHVELIPEIETWGHAKYITRIPDFADLAEDKDDPRALCTFNPATWELLSCMIDEVAELFPSKYIHLGCDEAPFGRCQICLDYADKHSMDALAGEHARRVCELALSRGKTPMIWGDVLLQHRGSVNRIPAQTVICDWHYDAQVSPESVEFFKKSGLDVLCCPAIVWGSRMILPRMDTLDNVESFAEVALENTCIGLKTTAWIPQRYIADTLQFGLAYACELTWSGVVRNRAEFAQAFALSYFGIEHVDDVAQYILDAHHLSDKSFNRVTNLWEHAEDLCKLTTSDLQNAEFKGLESARTIASTLRACRDRVTRNQSEYDALVLAASLGAHVKERDAALHRLVCDLRLAEELDGQGQRSEARSRIQASISDFKLLTETEELLRRDMEQCWDRWRYEDDPIKHSRGENILGACYSSEQFMRTVLSRLEDIRDCLSNGHKPDWQGVFARSECAAES